MKRLDEVQDYLNLYLKRYNELGADLTAKAAIALMSQCPDTDPEAHELEQRLNEKNISPTVRASCRMTACITICAKPTRKKGGGEANETH